MKTILLVSLWCCVLLHVRADKKESSVYSRFENIDVDQVLRSNRLVQNYINCLLDKGVCTADGKEIKRMLPKALASECEECTESQRKKAEKVIQFIINNKYPQFLLIEEKYDATQSYRRKFPQFFTRKQ